MDAQADRSRIANRDTTPLPIRNRSSTARLAGSGTNTNVQIPDSRFQDRDIRHSTLIGNKPVLLLAAKDIPASVSETKPAFGA